MSTGVRERKCDNINRNNGEYSFLQTSFHQQPKQRNGCNSAVKPQCCVCSRCAGCPCCISDHMMSLSDQSVICSVFTPPGCDQIESTAPSEASCAVPFSGNTGSDVCLFAGRHNDVCLLTSVVIFTQRRNYSWQCEMQSVKTFVNFWNDVDRSGAFRSCLVCWVSFYFQRRGSCLN